MKAGLKLCAEERTARERWPNAALPGALSAELAMPSHFEQAASLVRPDDMESTVITGPDPEPYLDAVDEYEEAGYDGVWFHQIGTDQRGFVEFAAGSLLSAVTDH